MEEHKKTNEMKHLEMITFFAVDKIEKLEETNSKLSKEVIRIGDLERSDKSDAEKIASLEATISQLKEYFSERERANIREKQIIVICISKYWVKAFSFSLVLFCPFGLLRYMISVVQQHSK